jgi:hypothetical protein
LHFRPSRYAFRLAVAQFDLLKPKQGFTDQNLLRIVRSINGVQRC